MIYPQNFEEKIGFDKIRKLLKGHCLSDLGKQLVDEIQWSTSYKQIDRQLHETNEFKRLLVEQDDFPVSYYIDVRPYLQRIKVEGMYLSVEEMFDFKRSLDAIRAVIRFLEKISTDEYPYIKELLQDITLYPFVIDRLDAIISKTGDIKDNASTGLRDIRRRYAEKEHYISKRMHAILRKAQNDELVDKDASLSVRDGKMLIPISTSNKRKIKGIVHDESASGKTSYIEPTEIVEANNELRELEFAERREIIKILIQFADSVRPYIEELIAAYSFLGFIDFLRAKAKFAIQIKAIQPNTFRNEAFIDWGRAIHPLLFLSLKKENKKTVPLNIGVNSKNRIVLISGPNAGGKSVCLKTVGLLQYMLQCGLLIPVNETSAAGIFHKIFIDIGDEQSLENDLSTYSSHLTNMKFFVENTNSSTLILIDEFGTGTEPMLGGAMAEAILEKLNARKTLGVITTHYTNLKHYATSASGIINGAMLFDSKRMQPLFQLETGQPGSSFAFEIAQKIGLQSEVLKLAAEKIGEDHVAFDKHLKDLEKEKQRVEDKKARLQQTEKKLNSLIDKFNREINYNLKERKNIIKRANDEAESILRTANKKIENTIFEIKKNEAEKEQTKKIREQLDGFKKEFLEKQEEKIAKIDRKMRKLKEREENRKTKTQNEEKKTGKIEKKERVDPTIHVGDSVQIKGQESFGDVIEIKNNDITVLFGQIKTTLHKDRLEKVSKNHIRKIEREPAIIYQSADFDVSKHKNEFNNRLDVRGKRADEALQNVVEFIDEALMAEVNEVKILHGTGHGILRQTIRNYLRTMEVVTSLRDEHIQYGGAGITIVGLE